MLQCHVKSALGIDLVGEGRRVISEAMEAQAEKNGRPVISLHQVSCATRRAGGGGRALICVTLVIKPARPCIALLPS